MAVMSGFSHPRSVGSRRLRQWHGEANEPTLVGTLLAERARAGSDDIALSDPTRQHIVTWGEVSSAAESWRSRLGNAWQQWEAPHVRIGLLMSSATELGREYFSALAAGVTVVALDHGCSESELLWSSASLGLTHLMTDDRVVRLHGVRGGVPRPKPSLPPAFADNALGLDSVPPFLDSPGVGRAWHPSVAPVGVPLPRATDLDHFAVVIKTKGRSGPPKLVPLSERQLLAAAAGVVTHFRLGPRDCGYIATPVSGVDTQVAGLLAVLLSGGSAVLADVFDRRRFWAGVEDAGATWLNLAPAMVTSLVGAAGPDTVIRDRVRFARVGGAALPLATHSKFWQRTGISLIETYTLTEAAGPVATNPLAPERRRPGSAGQPAGVEVRVVDDDGVAVPPGATGRIQLRGAAIATRYLSYGRSRSALTAQEADGWLSTGDVGCHTPEGFLYLAHREDGATERSSQVACGTPASPLRAAAFRP
jgi:acyl-CoA synthetase (AMP-forming)/AMP-acid ligase II